MAKSFKELKEENAALEAEAESNQNVIGQDAQDEESANEDVDINADESHEDGTEDGSEDGETLEAWQQTEAEDTSTDDQQSSGFVPNSEAAKRRKQNQALKGTVKEQESELDILRKENEELRAGVTPVIKPTEPTLSKRPDIADYDYDQAKFDTANDEWMDQRLEMKIKNLNQSTYQQQEQEQTQLKAQQQQKQAIDDHYARVNKLVESKQVKPDQYKMADTNFRHALESVFPNAGDQNADRIIATLNSLGEGSEKVIYSLGRNNKKLNELIGSINADQSGLQMMALLGKLHSEVQDPKKRRTNAPQPASTLSGDVQSKGGRNSLYKQWDKSKDVQTRVSLKRQARKAGEDVSKW